MESGILYIFHVTVMRTIHLSVIKVWNLARTSQRGAYSSGNDFFYNLTFSGENIDIFIIGTNCAFFEQEFHPTLYVQIREFTVKTTNLLIKSAAPALMVWIWWTARM